MRHRNPCSYLNRRLQIVATLTIIVLFGIIFLGDGSDNKEYLKKVPYVGDAAHRVASRLPVLPLPQKVNTAQWLNRIDPFQAPAHKPPADQPDSKAGDISWFSDWKWMNPFSTAVTQDDRSVLPPLATRPPVYTYFDASGRSKDELSRKAEQALLEIWRKAWWAKGFKPVVLSRSEAMNNPAYEKIKKLDLEPDMEMEMLRWMAWGNMGSGILCNWLAVPMANYDDPLLKYLRAGDYKHLTRYESLESGLFVGSKDLVDKAIQSALASRVLTTAKHMYQVVPEDTFYLDTQSDAIAFYSFKTVRSTYKIIADRLEYEGTRGEGMQMLIPLINSHLHMTWQSSFPKGIGVLKPLAQNTTAMIEPAIDVARNLSTCSASPMLSSCPPNKPKCIPCVSTTPMSITTPPIYRNDSAQFLIGTVPHPYFLQSLIFDRDMIDIKFIRRQTHRDVWIMAATKELLGTGVSPFSRIARFKEAVASPQGCARSLWLTAEEPIYLRTEKDMQELDWIFGFAIPRQPLRDGKSETPVPGPERRPPPPKQDFDGPKPSEQQLERQSRLGERARELIKKSERRGGEKPLIMLRNAIEAWNMADVEAWKFVRAFNARRQVERQKWQKEEEAYLGQGVIDRLKSKING